MANNCGTHHRSVGNGQLCPECCPGKITRAVHRDCIADAIRSAYADGLTKKDLKNLLDEPCACSEVREVKKRSDGSCSWCGYPNLED